MPLTPDEVQYVNRLLDKHLANGRSWRWGRVVNLVVSFLMLGSGFFHFLMASWTYDLAGWLPEAIKRHPLGVAASQPLTQRQFFYLWDTIDGSIAYQSRFAAIMSSASLMCLIMGVFLILLGARLVIHTLVRWNTHRRDAVFIKLLREKCRDELSAGSPTAG